MAGILDFVSHEESYKLRNFLKYHIFDTNYSDALHRMLFGQPIFSEKQTYQNVDIPLIRMHSHYGATAFKARRSTNKSRSGFRKSYRSTRYRRFKSRSIHKRHKYQSDKYH